jgi:hypothetical protein
MRITPVMIFHPMNVRGPKRAMFDSRLKASVQGVREEVFMHVCMLEYTDCH